MATSSSAVVPFDGKDTSARCEGHPTAVLTVLPTSPEGTTAGEYFFTRRQPVTIQRKIKLPFCAQYLVMRRINNFTKVAIVAGMVTLVLAGVKFYLAIKAERAAALATLQDTAQTVAKSLKLQMESDLASLDSIADLWHLDSRLSRPAFRSFITSAKFQRNLESMLGIQLVHRVPDKLRDALETDPGALQVLQECCNGTKWDIPGDRPCRAKAAFQCSVQGPPRLNFIEARLVPDAPGMTQDSIAPVAPEYLILTYVEPFERDPHAMGLNVYAAPPLVKGFLNAERTGLKCMSGRMAWPGPSFGLVVWNNLFVDKKVYGNRTLFQGVDLFTREEVISSGGDPTTVASVTAGYLLQTMLLNVITKVFGREIAHTRILLFDDRPDTADTARLLALYNPSMTPAEMNQEVQRSGASTKDQLCSSSDTQYHTMSVLDTDLTFTVAMVPDGDYMAQHTSSAPYWILFISIALVIIAQLERWMGHPWILSQHELVKATMEEEIRERVMEAMEAFQKKAQSADVTGMTAEAID